MTRGPICDKIEENSSRDRAKEIVLKKIAEKPHDEFIKALPDDDGALIEEYVRNLCTHIQLGKKDTARMLKDFLDALISLRAQGVKLSEALSRLDGARLGGFYSRPPIIWYPLDDAAKIYPLSMKHGQMVVFRLSVNLKKPVVPELLRVALAFTIKRFPSFATTVKKGFFWHYLDAAKRRYTVSMDADVPCRPLNVALTRSQSFRVVYYQNRISVEYFHILTDGTGGMLFIKALTAEYLRLTGVRIPPCEYIPDVDTPPTAEEAANAFPHFEKVNKSSGFLNKSSVQLSGALTKTKPCRILHFRLNAADLHRAAREKDATVTAYVLALMFLAGRFATDETNGSQAIQVPVNMRKYYPCDTVRNFSLYCGIRMPISSITTLDEILPQIASQLAEKASRESMNEMMRSTHSLVSMMRYVPLAIKAPVARAVYGFLGDKCFTNTLSNLGIVKLPDEMARHVDNFEFVLNTGLTNRASCTLVTFANVSTLTISKSTIDPSFEEKLYALLNEQGLTPAVEGSEIYEG